MPAKGAKKPAGKPKGVVSAYAFFVKEKQATVKVDDTEDKKMLLAKRSKILSAMWKELDDDEKLPYQAKSEADKKRHKKEMDVYLASNPQEKKKKKKEKDTTKPKKNLTAFFFFSSKYRSQYKAENPKASVGDISKMLGSRWGDMEEEEKEPFVQEAQRDKERYDQEMELWRKGEFNREDEQAKDTTEEEEDDDDNYSDAED